MPTVQDLGPHMEDDTSMFGDKPLGVHPVSLLSQNEDEDDDEMDETLLERLLGLKEMFPDAVRNGTSAVVTSSWNVTKWLYSISRTGLWVFASSATIIALPALLEKERMEIANMEVQQQREMLLGPNAAMAGRPGQGMMAPPQLMQMPTAAAPS